MQQITASEAPLPDSVEPGAEATDSQQGVSLVLFVAEMLLILALLIIASAAHSFSMLSNPFYLGDEGIYMYQAWAVVKEGRLDPYTYAYDHAPAGWLQIALWIIVLGGNFHAFGTAVETGRVLMLFYQLGSALLVYGIARRVSRNVIVAALACLLFSLAPYAIYLHRRVLLDNIMTFWVLLSAYLLLSRRLSLNHVWLSAVALAIGILSKENAVLVLPAFACLAFWQASNEQRLFATIGWITLVCSVVSLYALMAMLKGEFFPSGSWLGGTSAHVSLLGSIGWQITRERDGGLFNLHSSFWNTMTSWMQAEPFLVLGGLIASVLASLLIFIKKYRGIGCIGLANILLWLFLIRGGQVLGFYLAPELPFMVLSIVLIIWVCGHELRALLRRRAFPGRPLLTGFLVGVMQCVVIILCLEGLLFDYSSPALGLENNPLALWRPDPMSQAQKDATAWIENHIASCSSMIIDPYMWIELHDPSNGLASYTRAHSYWQVELDPAIRNTIFHNDWHNIDYVIATPGMISDTNHYQLDMVENALHNSILVASFSVAHSSTEQINVYKVNKSALNPDVGCSNLIGEGGSTS